jgi:hypothetical protein
MSTENERDMEPEYDFSGGVRGKYANRFKANKDEFLSAAAAMDRQAWLAHSLLAVQQPEANLVAYWALALGERPAIAGRTVSALLELLDSRALKKLQRDLDRHTSVSQTFHEEFRQLISDRNWLVHHSFLSPSAARLESISSRSRSLSDQIFTLLLERCTSRGMDPKRLRLSPIRL